jgi:hypothetical protein
LGLHERITAKKSPQPKRAQIKTPPRVAPGAAAHTGLKRLGECLPESQKRGRKRAARLVKNDTRPVLVAGAVELACELLELACDH